MQIQESSDSETVKDSVQCIRDSVVESVISLILESCNHANHATQVQRLVLRSTLSQRIDPSSGGDTNILFWMKWP